MGTTVSSVLKHKGHDVVTVAPQQTVTWVVKVLAQNRIGAVPVINEEGQLIGIISERGRKARPNAGARQVDRGAEGVAVAGEPKAAIVTAGELDQHLADADDRFLLAHTRPRLMLLPWLCGVARRMSMR